jgi:pterin-4a-carbinolamine dehydratase
MEARSFERRRPMSMNKAGQSGSQAPQTEEIRRPPVVVERLKAERVQEVLKLLPGWKVVGGGRAIERSREFDSRQAAASFASFVAGLAAVEGQAVDLHVSGGRAVVTLPGRAPRTRKERLTLEILDFARQIG